MSPKIEKVLILQGGGSLGAFGCGVFKALAKNSRLRQSSPPSQQQQHSHQEQGQPNCHVLDIVAGTSIGGVNASIIAGSNADHPEEALEQFWIELSESDATLNHSNAELPKYSGWLSKPWCSSYVPTFANMMLAASSDPLSKPLFSFYHSALCGNEKMFVPRWSPDFASKDPLYFTPQKWTYLYDHHPLEKTLASYIDYKKLRPGGEPNCRLIVTATNVLTAEPLTFDSSKQQITSKHVLATSAYPLYYFPWVEVEKGTYCWDGGLLSNTPLREVIDASPIIDKDIVIVENYPKDTTGLPNNLSEVIHRARDIIFSDKTLHNVKMSKVITQYLRFIDELYQIIEDHVDLSKLDEAKVAKIKRKYHKFKRERGAEIKKISYITREEDHPYIYENADFTVESIRESIKQGELATEKVLKENSQKIQG